MLSGCAATNASERRFASSTRPSRWSAWIAMISRSCPNTPRGNFAWPSFASWSARAGSPSAARSSAWWAISAFTEAFGSALALGVDLADDCTSGAAVSTGVGAGAREGVSEQDLGLGYPLGIEADTFVRTFEQALEARGVPFAQLTPPPPGSRAPYPRGVETPLRLTGPIRGAVRADVTADGSIDALDVIDRIDEARHDRHAGCLGCSRCRRRRRVGA